MSGDGAATPDGGPLGTPGCAQTSTVVARPGRLVGAALCCYPARWRRRHGAEAAELAVLLIRDGAPAAVIAVSYLTGAARAWLARPPGRPLSTAAAVLLAAACLLGSTAALVAETTPARAASTSNAPASHPPCTSERAAHARSC